ncbi:MAG TPA: oligosaccharide flippase family protein, partial [Rhodanobacteraceae bacterium]|nr:oligosaccharide flippase family protein [Rhodanobacteraceae bacterium]
MSGSAASYGQILRSSTIIGGAQAIKYVVGLLRIKIVAVLLGPAGVGLIGLYQSAVSLVGAGTGLGLNSSGVREVALAYQQGDEGVVARTVHALRRACWATGVLGWLAAIVLAVPLSQALTGSSQHAWAIAVLGGTLLLGAISGGQMALIQGQRRIGDIARVDVWAVLAQTVLAVGLYWWLGEAGIVPVLLATALITLVLSFRYAGKIKIARVAMHWRETVRVAAPLLRLGGAFMLSGLLAAGLDLLTRSVISQRLGIEATGIYQAAWALSGVFAAFILQAMGAD